MGTRKLGLSSSGSLSSASARDKRKPAGPRPSGPMLDGRDAVEVATAIATQPHETRQDRAGTERSRYANSSTNTDAVERDETLLDAVSRISRPVPSTTRPPFQNGRCKPLAFIPSANRLATVAGLGDCRLRSIGQFGEQPNAENDQREGDGSTPSPFEHQINELLGIHADVCGPSAIFPAQPANDLADRSRVRKQN
jgi:hypothetical protein